MNTRFSQDTLPFSVEVLKLTEGPEKRRADIANLKEVLAIIGINLSNQDEFIDPEAYGEIKAAQDSATSELEELVGPDVESEVAEFVNAVDLFIATDQSELIS